MPNYEELLFYNGSCALFRRFLADFGGERGSGFLLLKMGSAEERVVAVIMVGGPTKGIELSEN